MKVLTKASRSVEFIPVQVVRAQLVVWTSSHLFGRFTDDNQPSFAILRCFQLNHIAYFLFMRVDLQHSKDQTYKRRYVLSWHVRKLSDDYSRV